MQTVVRGTVSLTDTQISELQKQYVFDGLDWIPQSSTGGGGGGGTEYTEDAAAAANPSGPMNMLIRTDTPATQVSADGDNIAQRGTNFGASYVTLLDTGGNPVSVGGGTQYTEDVVSAADPIGTGNILRRRDSLSSEVSADGDYIFANATSKGEQYVKHVDAIPVTDNSGSLTVDNPTLSVVGGGTEATALRVTIASDSTGLLPVNTELPAAAALADAASATPTTPTVGSIGLVMNATTMDRQRAVVNALDSVGTGIVAAGLVGQLDDVSTGTVTENQFAPVRISTRRAVLVEGVASGTNLNTNVAQLAGTTTDTNSGNKSAGTLRVVLATDQPALTNKLLVTPDSVALPANQSVNVSQINGVTPLMGAGNTGTGSHRVTISTDQAALPTFGHGATAATVPVNGTYGGVRGTTALPTAVSDGQLVGLQADKFGRQTVVLGAIRDLRDKQRTTINASTVETTVITAGAAGVFNDPYMVIISNSSATAIRVDFRDATGGTIIFDVFCPAGQTTGFAIPGSSMPQTTAANNWTAQCSASVTDIRITLCFEKNK